MGKPLIAMMRTHDVAGGAGGPRSVGTDAFLDESLCGFDGIEIMRVGRQVAQRGATPFDERTDRGALCAWRLSSSTTSPRRRRGARPRRTQSMKHAFVIARHFVLRVSQPSRRMAPTSVRLSPQFIGRASTYSCPRWTHAWERPIAMFAPASSRKTRRFGSMRRTHLRNAARFA